MDRLSAGKRNKRIVIERLTAQTDGRGQPVKNAQWAEHAKAWAAVYYGTGTEQREAAQVQAQQAATFDVLANSKTKAITPGSDFRINFEGTFWNIRSVASIGFNEGIRINAVKLAA